MITLYDTYVAVYRDKWRGFVLEDPQQIFLTMLEAEIEADTRSACNTFGRKFIAITLKEYIVDQIENALYVEEL